MFHCWTQGPCLRSAIRLLFAGCVLLSGCSASGDGRPGEQTGVAGEGNSSSGGGLPTGDGALEPSGPEAADAGASGTSGPAAPVDCEQLARYVYLLDSDSTVIQYDPESGGLTPLGRLTCPVMAGLGMAESGPFAMAVERDASLLVMFGDGYLYRANRDGSDCRRVDAYSPSGSLEVFELAHARGPEASSDRLYFAGGSRADVLLTSARFGELDALLRPSFLGQTGGWPALTGNALGELWGFFPPVANVSTFATIEHIDSAVGAALERFDVALLTGASEFPVSAVASRWAFAHWGGRYYLFYQVFGLEDLSPEERDGAAPGSLAGWPERDPSSDIWVLDPMGRTFERAALDIGHGIVGAGVSTCAPVTLI